MAMEQNCWRDTARTVRIGFLDARACSGFFVWMLHMCWPTFILSLVIMFLFVLLDRQGISVPCAARYIKTLFLPPVRKTGSAYRERRRLRC